MLINCSDCNTEVSDKAEKCPKCGNPMTEETITEAKEKMGAAKKKGGRNLAIWIASGIVWFFSMIMYEPPAGTEGWWVDHQSAVIFAMLVSMAITIGGFWLWVFKRIRVLFVVG